MVKRWRREKERRKETGWRRETGTEEGDKNGALI